jgi:hypothetical protein
MKTKLKLQIVLFASLILALSCLESEFHEDLITEI